MPTASRSRNASLPIRGPKELLHLRVNELSPSATGDRRQPAYVVYWMQQQRRLTANFGLQNAAYRAHEHGLPLLIVEDLIADKPSSGDRHHAFAAAGMLDIRAETERYQVGYLPVVECGEATWDTVLAEVLTAAAEVITDMVPCHVVPGCNQRLSELAKQLGIRATAVDGNGLLPVTLLAEPCPTAAVFRSYLHKHAGAALASMPAANPLADKPLPAFDQSTLAPIRQQFPATTGWLDRYAASPAAALAECPIEHELTPVAIAGGPRAAQARLEAFLDQRLQAYDERNHPEADSASGLSPHLHWGHIGSHEIVTAVLAREPAFDPTSLPPRGGRREGFWPLSRPAQLFFDELITWRELSFHTAALMPDSTSYTSLPEWARTTLAEHADDQRPAVYTPAQLEAAETHEPIWNAAQRQLVQDGIIHNYLRMLWAKLILLWSATPEQAFETLVDLNNRYAIDGRDPNSWAGICWCFGRYDHPWQERAVYGTVRSMTAASTKRKLKLGSYLERYGPRHGQANLLAGL